MTSNQQACQGGWSKCKTFYRPNDGWENMPFSGPFGIVPKIIFWDREKSVLEIKSEWFMDRCYAEVLVRRLIL